MPSPAAWVPDIATIIEDAFERIGGEARTGYDIRTARRSLQFILASWENLQINLWRLLDESMTLSTGVIKYTLPADTIDLIDVTIADGVSPGSGDFAMSRISLTTWMQITNKDMIGRPVQFAVERHTTPSLIIWPSPQHNAFTLRWWRATRPLDVGNVDTTAGVPTRFLEALTAGLAWHLAMKSPQPQIKQTAQILKAYYDEQLALAQSEDRDRSPVRLVPRMYRVS
jgi:hypothetical protein